MRGRGQRRLRLKTKAGNILGGKCVRMMKGAGSCSLNCFIFPSIVYHERETRHYDYHRLDVALGGLALGNERGQEGTFTSLSFMNVCIYLSKSSSVYSE